MGMNLPKNKKKPGEIIRLTVFWAIMAFLVLLGISIFSPIKANYGFEKDIDISLTKEEALYISNHNISAIHSRDSLLAFIIKNKIDVSLIYPFVSILFQMNTQWFELFVLPFVLFHR